MNPQVADVLEGISTWLQLIVLVASVITLMITVGKTVQKPNRTQDDRLDALEKWQEKVDERLEVGNNHFDEIDEGNRITQEALLALISHDINGNDVDKLKDARDKLQDYLIKK